MTTETAQVALVSAPWPLFYRPSIQLGALKSWLNLQCPDIRVVSHHVYLSIAHALGYDLYGRISKRTWRAEALYAALLFPERRERISRFWRRQSADLRPETRADFEGICRRLEKATQAVIDAVPWRDYGLIGCSICFSQLTSTLFFLRRVKEKAPFAKVVVGGAACSGNMGSSLLETFPEIDFIIQGEGERPLAHLAASILNGRDPGVPSPMPGLVDRLHGQASCDRPPFSQVPKLDRLPAPDYTDYFHHLKTLDAHSRFLPEVPMEMSRGCWWRRQSAKGRSHGCAFCNLNIQWEGYRAKSQGRIVEELEELTEKYETLSIPLMDNVLPPGDLRGLFERIARLPRDLKLFAEIRATTSPEALATMGAAGVKEVQAGIEALSTRLLKRLNKGTTAITNLEIMKHCETPGLPDLEGNLILDFPGSDRQEVDETLKALEFAVPFRPLRGVSFWLGHGSALWRNPKGYGIERVHNHPFYAHLFPPEILANLDLMIKGYRGGIRDQQRLWRPVNERLQAWRTAYGQLHQAPGSDPILSYEDGGRFLIIRQRRAQEPSMIHWLRGTSRAIYLFCETVRSVPQILARFPGFGEDKVRSFLTMMADKKLMFREGDRYLSLAVPLRGWHSQRCDDHDRGND